MMYYYNQMDYPNIKYDNKSTSKIEMLDTAGCGPVAACIAVNNLADKEIFSVKAMTDFSVANGARDNSGTNINTLLRAVCKKYSDFSFTTTNDENKVTAHLKSGGVAIANQGDAYNVFSTAGHFVVLYRMSGNNIEVLDPQMYSGKYDAYSRPQRIVKKTTHGCIISTKELAKATSDRSPAYFLITYKPKASAPKVRFDAGSTYVLTTDVNVRTGAGTSYAVKKVSQLTADGKKNATSKNENDNATLKKGTKVTAQNVISGGGDIWLKIPSGYIAVYYNGNKYANWVK